MSQDKQLFEFTAKLGFALMAESSEDALKQAKQLFTDLLKDPKNYEIEVIGTGGKTYYTSISV